MRNKKRHERTETLNSALLPDGLQVPDREADLLADWVLATPTVAENKNVAEKLSSVSANDYASAVSLTPVLISQPSTYFWWKW